MTHAAGDSRRLCARAREVQENWIRTAIAAGHILREGRLIDSDQADHACDGGRDGPTVSAACAGSSQKLIARVVTVDIGVHDCCALKGVYQQVSSCGQEL